MRDFTFQKYNKLCISLLNNNFIPKRLDEFFEEQKKDEKTFIMRHDVDKKPENSLAIAKIEHELGIKSTFYFRTTNEVFKEDIICQIRDLGHEIGYHYEVLAKAKGDFELAIENFRYELSQFRKFTDIKTISRHGSPISKWNDLNLWNKYNYLDYGISCEAYLDLDYNITHYATDTGRCWNGYKYNIRDKVDTSLPYSDISITDDLINIIKTLKKNIIINSHPQRWNDGFFAWSAELILQNIKNLGKRFVLKKRKLS